MGGNRAPLLLIAVNGLDGKTQEFGDLFLGFAEGGPGLYKLCTVHKKLLFIWADFILHSGDDIINGNLS